MELNGQAWAAGLHEHDARLSRAVFDASAPNVARIYDYLLGGKDNFAADRDAAEELRTALPDVALACRQNREFLRRAVRYLAGEAGLGQFIDVGSGLPTASNTHQIAQAVRPGARVVYADNDPVVVTHGRALLQKSPDVAVIDADLRQPGAIIGDPLLGELVDFAEPVAFLLVAVLHFIQDSEDPYGIVATLRSVMAPGSFLVISHATQDGVSPKECAGGVSVYEKASAPVVPRRHHEVLKFFDGLDLVEPGLVNISQWHTAGEPVRQLIYGGVACKRLSQTAKTVSEGSYRTVPSGGAREERAMSDVEKILLDPPDWSVLSNDQLTVFAESVNSLLDYGIFRPPLATELVRYRDAASDEVSARVDRKLRRPRKDRDQGT